MYKSGYLVQIQYGKLFQSTFFVNNNALSFFGGEETIEINTDNKNVENKMIQSNKSISCL